MEKEVIINSKDYWFKVVDMLQQNWALIATERDNAIKIIFLSDASGIFDEIIYKSKIDAELELKRNGFKRFTDDKEAQKFISPPTPPFYWKEHPNGRIYSSGRFWK